MNLKFKMQKELIIFNFYHYLPVWNEVALLMSNETRRQYKISNVRRRSIILQKIDKTNVFPRRKAKYYFSQYKT